MTPSSVTFSVAAAEPRLDSQRGSEYDRLTRCAPTCSAQPGSIDATIRAHSRDVSTSSAAITSLGCRLASTEPGQIENRAPRVPWKSRLTSSQLPMWASSPDSSAWWIRVASMSRASESAFSFSTVNPVERAICRSCPTRSCHSRTRR